MLGISGGCFAVRLIRELDGFLVFEPFFGVRLIRILYAQFYGIYETLHASSPSNPGLSCASPDLISIGSVINII